MKSSPKTRTLLERMMWAPDDDDNGKLQDFHPTPGPHVDKGEGSGKGPDDGKAENGDSGKDTVSPLPPYRGGQWGRREGDRQPGRRDGEDDEGEAERNRILPDDPFAPPTDTEFVVLATELARRVEPVLPPAARDELIRIMRSMLGLDD